MGFDLITWLYLSKCRRDGERIKKWGESLLIQMYKHNLHQKLLTQFQNNTVDIMQKYAPNNLIYLHFTFIF